MDVHGVHGRAWRAWRAYVLGGVELDELLSQVIGKYVCLCVYLYT